MYSDQWTKVVLLVSVRVVIARKSVLWIQLQWSDIISVRWRFSVTSNPNGVQLRIQQEQIVHWYISIIFYPILIPKVTVLLLFFFLLITIHIVVITHLLFHFLWDCLFELIRHIRWNVSDVIVEFWYPVEYLHSQRIILIKKPKQLTKWFHNCI